MMHEHPGETRLQDFADGSLHPDDHAAVAAHVAACSICSADVAQIRSLLRDLQALPRALQPPRDLLPGIHAGIEALAAPSPIRSRPLWSLRYPLAAAALLLIALSAVATLTLVRTRAPVAADPAGAEASLAAIEAEYARAAGELLATLHAQRAQLSPTTVRLIERDVAMVDRAIREARAELAQQPQNHSLPRLILAGYEQKLSLLRHATESAQGAPGRI